MARFQAPRWAILVATSAVCPPIYAQNTEFPPLEPVTLNPPERKPTAWTRRPLAIEMQASLGGPLGLAGAAVDYSLSSSFSLNIGVGAATDPPSPRGAVMSRVRLPIAEGLATGVEGGLSIGKFDSASCLEAVCDGRWRWPIAVFAAVGMIVDWRTDDSTAIRLSGGLAGVLNLADGRCRTCDAGASPSVSDITVPYVLLSIGWALKP